MHVISGVLVRVSDYSLCDRREKGWGLGWGRKTPPPLTLSVAFYAGYMYLLIMSDCLYALRLLVVLFFLIWSEESKTCKLWNCVSAFHVKEMRRAVRAKRNWHSCRLDKVKFSSEQFYLLPVYPIFFGATHFNRYAVSEKYGSTGFNNLICHNQRG